jgi:predicted Zn-dependent peptidase
MLKPQVLKNGLTVIKLPKPGNIFTIGFVAQTGAANEKDHFPGGISHLVERLFWCGTDKHPSKRQLNRALESMGGNFASQTTLEFTEYYITVPSEHQFKAVTMMAEIVQHSHFDDRDIATEKQSVIQRSTDYLETPDSDFSPLATENIFERHAYSSPLYGDIESIMRISKEDIQEFISSQYNPDHTYLVLSGDIQTKEISDMVSQEWGLWYPKVKQYNDVKRFPIEEVKSDYPSILYKQRGLPETQMVCGILLDEGLEPRVIRETSEEARENLDIEKIQDRLLDEWAHLLLLNAILGQGLSSRLWLKGVEEEMLFDDITSQLIMLGRSGFIQIEGKTDNSQFTFALESVLSVLSLLKQTTVSLNEITKAKEALKGKIIMEHEDLLASTVWQIETMVSSGLTFDIHDLLNKIKRIEAGSIRLLADNLFRKEKFFLTTLGTSKETNLVSKLIEKYL